MKVIIAGSRDITDMDALEHSIKASGFTMTAVIEGGARGADRLGRDWAMANNVPYKTVEADWRDLDHPRAIIKHNAYGEYNAMAGHIRNRVMADQADALIALWDGKSRGTENMINIMKSMDKPVFVHII